MRQTHIKAATSLLCLFHWNVWAKTIEPINPWDMEQITDTRPICTYQDTEWRAKEWRFGENMFGFNEAWWWDIERGDKVNVTRDGYVMQIFLGAGKGYSAS